MIAATTTTETESLLLTEREAAQLLSISPRTLWGLSASGILPCVKLSPRIKRYRRSTIERVLAEMETTSTTD